MNIHRKPIDRRMISKELGLNLFYSQSILSIDHAVVSYRFECNVFLKMKKYLVSKQWIVWMFLLYISDNVKIEYTRFDHQHISTFFYVTILENMKSVNTNQHNHVIDDAIYC